MLWNSAAKALVREGFATEEHIRVNRDTYGSLEGQCPDVKTTPDQAKALSQIVPSILKRENKTFLLHGVTGSGKTEVYLQAAKTALEAGRQVLVLIPEIAQTGQLLKRFKARFGGVGSRFAQQNFR